MQILIGILSRMGNINSLPITVKANQTLSILVENQGRVNYGNGLNDFQVPNNFFLMCLFFKDYM